MAANALTEQSAAPEKRKSMKKFIVKRLLLGVVILFFVSLIIYSIERSLPTSYVKEGDGDVPETGAKPYEELLDDLNAAYGLDKPVLRALCMAETRSTVISASPGYGPSR